MRRLIWMLVLVCCAGLSAARAEESCGPQSGLCWPKVERGASGPRVMALQYLLLARGYKIAPDGEYGYTTESAVRKFQKKNKLKIDGKIGWQSWEALTPPLKAGAGGNPTRALQTLLIQAGYKLKRDGVFGNSTAKALLEFEKKSGFAKTRTEVDDPIWCFLSGGIEAPGC